MKPLQALALLDGRLGHEKQTRGVLQALGNLTTLEVEYRTLPPGGPASELKYWLRFLLPWLGGEEAHQGQPVRPVDLIIGAGCRTHLPMMLQRRRLRRAMGIAPRIITFMLPNFPLLYLMDLVFVPRSDRLLTRANTFRTVGPPNTAGGPARQQADRGLILIGGIDHKSHFWDTQITGNQIRRILQREPERRWTLASSPRTPAEMNQALADLAVEFPGTVFYPAAQTPPGWIEEQYAANQVVWVTADSLSMIYESLTAGCLVGLLPVKWKKRDSLFNRSENYLQAEQLVVGLDQWLAGAPLPAPPLPLNEAQRCAREILQRWWPERLQNLTPEGPVR